jgi:pimeloyl-ACP methyl ester carboxylesterase
MRRGLIALGVVLAAVLGLGAYGWTPDRSVESLTPRWAQPPSKFVTVDGLSVHLRNEGPGDDPHPIVLLHGTASSLHTWQGWTDGLKAQHRVVRFDLPGAGLTGPFPDDDYRIGHSTRFVADLLDQLGVKHAVVVGNSLGGYVAWEMAIARPDLVERLVLIDARGYPDTSGETTLAERLMQVPGLGPFVIEHFTPRSLIEKSVASVMGDPRKATAEQMDRTYELLLRAGNRRALMLQNEQIAFTESERIKAVAVPTLVLWGALDQRVPLSHAARFHDDIAGSALVVLSGLGHIPQEEDPARTLRAFEAFLAARPLS